MMSFESFVDVHDLKSNTDLRSDAHCAPTFRFSPHILVVDGCIQSIQVPPGVHVTQDTNNQKIEVWVQKQVIVQEAVQCMWYTTHSGKHRSCAFTIYCASDSQLTWVDHIEGTGMYGRDITIHAFLESRAQLNYIKIQNESADSYHQSRIFFDQKKESHVYFLSLIFGAQFHHETIFYTTCDVGTHISVNGLYVLKPNQWAHNHIRMVHEHAECSSDQNYRGILAPKSHAVFFSEVWIQESAPHTKTHQKNHNLLLGEGASIDSRPTLQIDCNEVQCAHGATTGYLDPMHLLYLKSRGIPERAARHLLIQGFAETVLESIQDTQVLNDLKTLLTTHLNFFL